MTTLYYVHAEEFDGIGDLINMDLVVEANDVAEVFDLWREYYSDEFYNDIRDSALADMTIWTLPERIGQPHAYRWHSEVRPIDFMEMLEERTDK